MSDAIKPGDRVSYTQSARRGSTIDFTTKRGVFIKAIGKSAIVRAPNHQFVTCLFDTLRPVSARSHLGDAVVATSPGGTPTLPNPQSAIP